jgi:hypothetical protein
VHKLLMAAVAAAVAVAGFAAFAFAKDGPNDTAWNFTFSKHAENKPTGSNSILEPAKRDTKGTEDPSDDHYDSPSKSVIEFPAGSNINTAAKPRCKESESDVQSGRESCPKKTKIGSGLANSLLGQPEDGAGTPIVAPIDAFNQKNGIMFVVKPCSPGTGPGMGSPCTPIPGGTVVLPGTWSKANTKPTLTVPTPASLQQGGVIITRFQLKTGLFNSDAKGSYATTPDICPNSDQWISTAKLTYPDGSKLTIKDPQPCNG